MPLFNAPHRPHDHARKQATRELLFRRAVVQPPLIPHAELEGCPFSTLAARRTAAQADYLPQIKRKAATLATVS
jgi:hypothetical protein